MCGARYFKGSSVQSLRLCASLGLARAVAMWLHPCSPLGGRICFIAGCFLAISCVL